MNNLFYLKIIGKFVMEARSGQNYEFCLQIGSVFLPYKTLYFHYYGTVSVTLKITIREWSTFTLR